MGRRTEAREAVELPVELGWEGRRMRVVRRESRVRKAFCSVGDVRFDKEGERGHYEELRVSGGRVFGDGPWKEIVLTTAKRSA